ncbi:hypothetical protein ABXJ76_07835 [Methylobacter sp. G7]|uniref:hypothetical protein n=1 Tax=Methylobacter sp. G7 TaxID=3230117 RepID=UPI003D80863E
MTEPCSQLHRIDRLDEIGRDLKMEIQTIRSDVDEIKASINDIKINLCGFTASVSSVMQRMDERDQRTCDMQLQNKDTFGRFGQRIEILEAQITAIKIADAHQAWIGKIVWAAMGSVGAVSLGLIILLMQKAAVS